MKRIKDRPMTDTLLKQLIQQKHRLNDCSKNAFLPFTRMYASPAGTFYSQRFVRKEEVL